MKTDRPIGRMAGLGLAGHLVGCSAILGIGDLPSVTDGGAGTSSSGNSSMGAVAGGVGGGVIMMGSGSSGNSSSGSSSSGSVSCNPTSSSAACNECIVGSCCDSFASCANDPTCAGAFECYSSNSTIAGFCDCLAVYGGYVTVLDAPFTACDVQDCASQCGTAPVGALCAASAGCALGPCVENSTGEDACFQFCCNDSDCPSGSTCVSATNVEGLLTQVCAN